VVHSTSSIKHFYLNQLAVEGEGIMILENMGNRSSDETDLYPRRPWIFSNSAVRTWDVPFQNNFVVSLNYVIRVEGNGIKYHIYPNVRW